MASSHRTSQVVLSCLGWCTALGVFCQGCQDRAVSIKRDNAKGFLENRVPHPTELHELAISFSTFLF